MKKLFSVGVVFLLIACSGTENTPNINSLATRQDSISYSIGMDIGGSFRMQELNVESEYLYQGFLDSYNDTRELIPQEERQALLMSFQQELREEQMARQQRQAAENLLAAKDFLNENSGKAGVVVLPSGLQYKIITEGNGPKPEKTDRVKVHYRGTLIDETEFDSSYKRGKPAEFSVGGVIRGWVEALQLMPVGSTWELYIPPELGYGERGSQNIPPNSALVFEVELIDIIEK